MLEFCKLRYSMQWIFFFFFNIHGFDKFINLHFNCWVCFVGVNFVTYSDWETKRGDRINWSCVKVKKKMFFNLVISVFVGFSHYFYTQFQCPHYCRNIHLPPPPPPPPPQTWQPLQRDEVATICREVSFMCSALVCIHVHIDAVMCFTIKINLFEISNTYFWISTFFSVVKIGRRMC